MDKKSPNSENVADSNDGNLKAVFELLKRLVWKLSLKLHTKN